MYTKAMILDYLQKLNIPTQTIEHEPLFTCDQAPEVTASIPAEQCKNLFLKDSKKRLWLVVACADTQINLKELRKTLQAPELRFAQAELLQQHLGVLPGSVTPFGIINDAQHQVNVIVDQHLFTHKALGFHPLQNDATTVINPDDLMKFFASLGVSAQIIDFRSNHIP